MINSILIVDDEPYILNSMKELLELENKTVEVADNGSTALEKVLAQKYDLIISDAKMPKMNGQQLLSEIRKNDKVTKFIILTGESEYSQEKLKEMGADAVFYKPLDFDILLETIAAL